MVFLIETNSGATLTPESEGWDIVDFNIPDVTTQHRRKETPGVPGVTPMGTDIGIRENIEIIFDYPITDVYEYQEKWMAIQDAFSDGPFKLFVSTRTSERGSGRYLLLDKDSLSVEKVSNHRGRVTVSLSTHQSPFFMTRGRSTTTISGASATFNNPGTTELDHRYTDTEIVIRMNGSSDGFTITVNGEDWSYNGSTFAGDWFTLKDGDAYLGDNHSIFGDVSHNVIVFKPGSNTISVTGAAGYEMEIITRYYYH